MFHRVWDIEIDIHFNHRNICLRSLLPLHHQIHVPHGESTLCPFLRLRITIAPFEVAEKHWEHLCVDCLGEIYRIINPNRISLLSQQRGFRFLLTFPWA
jgi:hypothetical protein